MPSDDRTPDVMRKLGAAREAHQSSVAMTVEEVRGYLEAHHEEAGGRKQRMASELGAIGERNIDAGRFASLLGAEPVLNGKVGAVMKAALETLQVLAQRDDGGFIVSVRPGGSVVGAVGTALSAAGGAFGAARVVRLARNGAYRRSTHDTWLSTFPFTDWNAAERNLAPPLVVEVHGADLRVAGLSDFLDGRMKIVLIVTEMAPPAPLVRLISPGVFVAQSTDDTPLERLAAWEGPGIVALMPRGAARFTHDPASGPGLAERLTVTEIPEELPKRRLGAYSARQQQDELAQLVALRDARSTAAATSSIVPAATPNPVDKLATWLMQQADLSGVE